MPQQRVELLRGDSRRGQRHIDANRPGGAHRVSRVADEYQSITRPIFDQGDLSSEWEKWPKVAQAIGEIREDRIKATHALGHGGDTCVPPVPPGPCREKQSSLNLLGIFGEHQTPHVRSQREINGIWPVRRLLDDKPDDVEVVILIFNLKVAQAPHRRRSSIGPHNDIGSDLKWLLAMAKTTDAGDRIPLLNELSRLGPHPALKA